MTTAAGPGNNGQDPVAGTPLGLGAGGSKGKGVRVVASRRLTPPHLKCPRGRVCRRIGLKIALGVPDGPAPPRLTWGKVPRGRARDLGGRGTPQSPRELRGFHLRHLAWRQARLAPPTPDHCRPTHR